MNLRKTRVALALLFGAAITLLFIDFTGAAHQLLGWTAKIQFLPALLALNVGVVVGLLVLTLLLGRVYCSVICPLGVFQDAVSYFSGKRKGKKNRFRYSPAVSWLRYGMLAVLIVAVAAGASVIVSLLDPYASYGRVAANLLAPLYRWGNNLLAWLAERADSYAFYSTAVWLKGGITFGIAVVTLVAVGVLAWRNGRTYCNTICPVGTLLGFVSRFSLLRVVFDEEKCTKCRLCERRCKASCIDVDNMRVDYSRCVSCFTCIDSCKFDAMTDTFRKPKKQPQAEGRDDSRRKFFAVGALLASAVVLKAQEKGDGGLALIVDKKKLQRNTPVFPAGAESASNVAKRCTGCQLCISECPNHVLRPSSSLDSLMQPEMSFERGYCRPECTRCSEVCPTGAIKRVSRAERSSIQVGQAVWVKQRCLVVTDNVTCGNCARHCPTGAILMVENPEKTDGNKIPAVNVERCIGCGACENLCPSRPLSAIYVEGYERHKIM